MNAPARSRWYPIAAGHDLPFRHVYHGQLLGRELAVWRADDGYVNVWENRCLHRGVRLSIGISDGAELKCQYHGWRYASRTAGCTYIPAHPADAPARTLCNRSFPAVERFGLIWTCEGPGDAPPDIPELDRGSPFVLRGIPVNAPADSVVEKLADHRFQPSARLHGDDAEIRVEAAGDRRVRLTSTEDGYSTTAFLFVQPVDSHRCVIRGVLRDMPDRDAQMAVLRHHNRGISRLRDLAEAEAADRPERLPVEPVPAGASTVLAAVPEPIASGRSAHLRVRVERKWPTAKGIAGFELAPVGAPLPTCQPGAHIDVHMPDGIVRQYSLTNGPGETGFYRIGVKLEPESRGGSEFMHRHVKEGDVLSISEPHNNFPLRRDSARTLLIAGGIGITPLISMARTLDRSKLSYKLHYFCRSDAHVAFPETLKEQGNAVQLHFGLDPGETAERLRTLLAGYAANERLYICGPGPLLETTRKLAGELGWPEGDVHFEYFKNTNRIDDSSSFTIRLARSVATLHVPAGKTMLEVLREHGVNVPSSCEQGACGTCAIGVLDGVPLHQDVYLNDNEKRDGKKIICCVSRARSAHLVLDV